MSEINVKKMALAFSLLAFAILLFGSVLNGSRVTTGLIRGAEAALVFGGLAWLLGSIWTDKKVHNPPGKPEEQKGAQVDKVI
ncbi:MAG: hypothetical protein ACE5E9_00865 [Nitrospinaceae bacterium]